MSDSDKDTSAAIDKAVDAFRAQREQGKAEASEAGPDTPAQSTPVTRLPEDDVSDRTPQGGGGSDAPTQAFRVPDEVAAAAALREEHVVGEPSAPAPPDTSAAAPSDAQPAQTGPDLVEQSIDLPSQQAESPADTTPTEKLSTDDISEASTQVMPAPAAAAAGADAPTEQLRTPAAAKPEPQVVAPSDDAPAAGKRKRGRLAAILLAVAVVVIVAAIGAWFLFFGANDQDRAADTARDYQKAMNNGDLDTLRDITCGSKKEYYSEVSAEEFAKAYNTQKSQNQMMTFDDVNAVKVDGDTALVGVDIYPMSDPSKTAPAQITLHKIDGAWKVCTKP